MRSGFEVSNHTFVNLLCVGIIRDIETLVPGLNALMMNKRYGDSKINVTIVGQKVVGNELNDTKNRVESYINKINNEVELINRVRE